MPPARREPRYSVQDVIDMVQNGESEVEMELNDTDESDEDSDEDVCQEVDKENQPPMDCPADDYVDIEPKTNKHTMPRDRYRWLKKDFISPNTDFSGLDITADDISLHTPLEYFQKFVSEDMVEALTQNTNEYSFQAHGTSVNTTAKEIEKMLGMYLKMGLVQMAGTRMYWETETRYSPVADVMPRNRFQSLLTSLHFVNNMTVSETQKKDKLWKLRPWLDSFREKCLQVVPEEHNSVDEMHDSFQWETKPTEPTLKLRGLTLLVPTTSTWEVWICWTHLQPNTSSPSNPVAGTCTSSGTPSSSLWSMPGCSTSGTVKRSRCLAKRQ